MNKARLEELREETTQYRAVADDRCMSTQYEDDLLALIDAEIARQSVTDEAVRVAIDWLEAEKASAQNDWERAGAEWRMEPGAQAQHDERMASFDLAIQALCQMKPSEWIPVSERLPTEELASVLVYTKDGGVSEGQYYPTIKSWKQFRWSVENATVTHWMPLPKPPESED